jgi:hypothetical protein
MALIALKTADRVEVIQSHCQLTLVAAEAITAGACVRIDTDGKFTNGNGTSTTENNIFGIATRTVAAGEPVTAIRRGLMDGFTFSQAYAAPIYASDTDGRLGDAAGTASKLIGMVVAGTSNLIGTSPDKILLVDINL